MYLDESAPGYVDREEPSLAEGIERIRQAGGITSLAHPIRLGKHDPAEEEELILAFIALGLDAIEAYHSDHRLRMSPLSRVRQKYGSESNRRVGFSRRQ